MNEIETKLNTIMSSIINNISSDKWENLSVNICALNKMISIKSFYEEKGKFTTFDPEENGEDVTMKIKVLRELMYDTAPSKGAWYSATFSVVNNGRFQTFFDYDNQPEFKYEPSNDKFIDDLKNFPREDILIPEWLKKKINLK